MTSIGLSLFVFVLALGPVYSGYVVTTPRRWTIGAHSQICASLNTGAFSASDSLKYKLTELIQKAVLQNETALTFPSGENFACVSVPVPYTTDRIVTIVLTGTLASETVSDMANLTFVEGSAKTFIQTDKYLYKPGQEVQFRILSVKDPNITVVTQAYEEIYVNNPSRTRIAQWKNVNNSQGLVHLSFDLHDEVVEGTYIIGAKFADKPSEEKIFRVEEYVLPRYEVTIDAPKTILGSDESVTVKVCAKYTFGEPVKGNATIYLAAASWKVYANLTESKHITGCENFTFPSKDLLFDHNNCHIRISNLQAHAVVIEDGTLTELHGDNNFIQVHRRAIQFRDRSPPITQKPYLPAAIQIDAVFPDNSPASNEIMKVCTYYKDEEVCKNFTTNAQGTISFVMPSQIATRLEVKAVKYPQIERNWNDVMEESSFFKYSFNADEYVDAMNASLTIMKDKIKCNTGAVVNFSVPVIYIAKDQSTTIVHLQISSRGQVVLTQNMDVKFIESKLPIKDVDKLLPLEEVPAGLVLGSFEIPVALTEDISPKISILVWYANEDGTVVADTSEVDVTECLSHKVDFKWSVEKAEPGQQANIMIKGANNALCSIGVVDKSVDLLSTENNKLDIQSLLQITYNSEVARWDENQLNLEYCYRKYNYSGENITLDDPTGTENEKVSPMSSGFTIRRPYNRYSMLEAIHMFSNAGYYVFSNLVLEKRFCDDLIIEDLKNKASALSPDMAEQDSVSAHRIPAAYAPQAAFGPPAGAGFGGGSQEKILVDAAPSLASSPAPANKEGEVEPTQERSYLPETWLWLLKPLSATGELNEAVELPDTITQWIGNTVCVHPSEGVGIASSSITTFTPFFVDLTLPATATRGEILPIKISIFNYLKEDLPVKVVVEASKDYAFVAGETGTREICVSSKDKMVEIIKVNLTRIGDINITVDASAQPLTSGSCGSGTPPTKKDRLIRSLPVDPEGYLREKAFTEYFCSQDVENTEGLSDFWVTQLPASTSEGSARSWITVIGDLMGPTVENIGNLVRFPSGCGEQNMVNFAPNIYILQYLEASNQTTPLLKEKITKYLNQGYQRQLLFKHEADSSYSTFGENDAEGSTWLTAFVVKSFAQAKPYTLIDKTSLRKSAEWLKNLQNKEGCFESKGRVINKMLQGGITGSDGSEGLLTAYVLAAILEEGNVTEEMKVSAIKCIEANSSTHPYSLALKSYSLALANSSDTKATIDKLMATSVSNTSMLRWDLPDREGQNTALHVETAAYALLALVTYDYNSYKDQTRKIVRWISSNRNGQGGFVSTQDTVVALQALASFEKVQTKEPLNMEISVASSKINHLFNLTEDNKFLQQIIDVPTPSVNVTLTVSGTGCALIQGVLRYNVLTDSKSEVLTLKVNTSHGNDCKTQNISACATYTLPDGASNMAIMEFKLVTGYIPIKQDLKDIVGDGRGTFKRYEVDGPKVTFYLEELTAMETCASIRVYQEVEIENVKPGSVTVYDYYQPEYMISKKYNLTSTCGSGASTTVE